MGKEGNPGKSRHPVKSYAVTLAALILFAGLYGYWHFRVRNQEPVRKVETGPALVEADVESLREITIEGRKVGQNRLVLRKLESGKWALVEPEGYPTNESTVKLAVDQLAKLKGLRLIAEEATDLTPFGLHDPSLRVEGSLEDGRKVVVEVGDETPVGGSYYARETSAPRVVTISNSTYEILGQDLNALVEKILADFDRDAVTRITLDLEGKSRVLERTETGWKSRGAAGGDVEIARDGVDKILFTLRWLFADAIPIVPEMSPLPPDLLSGYGLHPPRLVIKLELAESDPLVFTIGTEGVTAPDSGASPGKTGAVEVAYVLVSGKNLIYPVRVAQLEPLAAAAAKILAE
ncbi:MAG: DUF4340 domain-containing protein [Firmicutes bacterium]|nr:DUF4340 domain-containing protein [Bacillota bacterium]